MFPGIASVRVQAFACSRVLVTSWLLLTGVLDSDAGGTTCPVDQVQTGTTFTLRLGDECTQHEREARAVAAGKLLAALKDGKAVDLVGVVVTGELSLHQLPLIPVKTLRDLLPRTREMIRQRSLNEVRIIAGPLSLHNCIIRGAIRTGITDGLIVIGGPVTMTGTTFERSLDLSLAAFDGPVDFSHAILLREGYFIKALFTQPARFEQTAFGTHSRFHRAIFAEPVTFHRAGFNGLAEFLEVTFEQDARFSQTYFKMGTGFSGSRFQGPVDFSESVFEREAYFTFTLFEGDAYFRRATFRGEANFSDAEFKGLDDFSKTLFTDAPRFTRTKVSRTHRTLGGLQDPRFLYSIAAALLLFAVVFVILLKRNV
jgi:uncharacterized protein YjbI with pentapeptide repeats